METQLKRHEPLYLKHRPQSLEQLVGQAAVTTTLVNAINYDRLTHAYLFTGPRGTGKTSTARILAKSLNCKNAEKATTTPCQECTSCIEIKNCTSPAVLEIDAASNNSVDDARVLIERAPLMVPGARYKIYIIDECHMLTKEAFNALLKTIEEAPPQVVFVLATTEEHKVLPTIVSRCQRLMFRLATQDDLLAHLRSVAKTENIEITDRALDFITRRSGGGLRDALGLLDQASLLSAPGKPVDITELLTLLGALHEDVLLQMSEHVLHRRGHELIADATKLLQEGREPAIVVQEMARHFLNLTKASYLAGLGAEATGEMVVGSPNYLQGLIAQAPQFERSELTQLVEALDRLEQTCRRSTQPAMHLEVGLLALCHRQDMLLVRELAERVTRLEHALAGGASIPAPASVRPSAAPAPARPAPIAPAPSPVAATPVPAAAGGSPLAQPHSSGQDVRAPQPVSASAPAPVSGQDVRAPQPVSASAPAPVSGQDVRAPQPVPASAPAPAPDSVPAVMQAAGPRATTAELAPEPELPPHLEPANVTIAPEPLSSVSQTITTPQNLVPAGGSPLAGPAPTAGTPAPQKAAPPPAPPESAGGEDEASADEVDRVWSQTLDELQRRHIPTFSLASVHAIPISLTDKEFILGTKETFVKTLEVKLDHLKAATSAVLGKAMQVRIRAVTMDVPKRAAAKPVEREQRPPAPASPPPQGAPGPDADDEEYEPARSYQQPQYNSAPSESAPPQNAAATQQQEAAPAPRPTPQAAPAERGNDSTVIKEAYKLFEGPGSRQIGDKK